MHLRFGFRSLSAVIGCAALVAAGCSAAADPTPTPSPSPALPPPAIAAPETPTPARTPAETVAPTSTPAPTATDEPPRSTPVADPLERRRNELMWDTLAAFQSRDLQAFVDIAELGEPGLVPVIVEYFLHPKFFFPSEDSELERALHQLTGESYSGSDWRSWIEWDRKAP